MFFVQMLVCPKIVQRSLFVIRQIRNPFFTQQKLLLMFRKNFNFEGLSRLFLFQNCTLMKMAKCAEISGKTEWRGGKSPILRLFHFWCHVKGLKKLLYAY